MPSHVSRLGARSPNLAFLVTYGVLTAALVFSGAFNSLTSADKAPKPPLENRFYEKLVKTELKTEGTIKPAIYKTLGDTLRIPAFRRKRAAQEQKVAGKAVTPFLLARINALSDGRSLAANIALGVDPGWAPDPPLAAGLQRP